MISQEQFESPLNVIQFKYILVEKWCMVSPAYPGQDK